MFRTLLGRGLGLGLGLVGLGLGLGLGLVGSGLGLGLVAKVSFNITADFCDSKHGKLRFGKISKTEGDRSPILQPLTTQKQSLDGSVLETKRRKRSNVSRSVKSRFV
jgi:hypothetical protein